jgi:hypothetical protein
MACPIRIILTLKSLPLVGVVSMEMERTLILHAERVAGQVCAVVFKPE